MKTVIAYVSNDMKMDIPMNPDFAGYMLYITADENVLIGSKQFEQDMQEQGMPGTHTYVLSRHKRFTGAKQVTKPEDFKDGYIVGGKSTISSMLPYCNSIILGVDDKCHEFGISFPNIDDWNVVEEMKEAGYTIKLLSKE